MKLIAAICFLSLITTSSIAQESGTVSDLRIKVDSIIRYQIAYVIDSTTNARPAYQPDTIPYKGLRPAPKSFPLNPMPQIVLDGQPIKSEKLNGYKLEEVAEIRVFPKNDHTAMALYGSSARNGLIIIQLKK
ncbi:hypothetical protein [Salinimicrobium xinjiangense]|uniref:hypothetical protein n=1 Tax=Salinimicrobium xinjiangense TaxID=438596 RepID=UPI0003F82233|nr:hypothetical protein [Salinimicrobium xinjiangense]